MVEIFQSRDGTEMSLHSILRVTFVVSALGLFSSQLIWCEGMSNAYVVRIWKLAGCVGLGGCGTEIGVVDESVADKTDATTGKSRLKEGAVVP
jgi:hypothetical protein